MELYSAWPCVSGFFHVASWFPGFAYVATRIRARFLGIWLNNIPRNAQTTRVCVFTSPQAILKRAHFGEAPPSSTGDRVPWGGGPLSPQRASPGPLDLHTADPTPGCSATALALKTDSVTNQLQGNWQGLCPLQASVSPPITGYGEG